MGGKSSTSTQSVSIPPQVLAQYSAVNARANQTAQTPFQTYGGEFVAPVNAQQSAGIAATNASANEAQPYYSQATNTLNAAQAGTAPVNAAAEYGTAASAAPLTGSQINQYLSPYLGDVLGSTEALQNQENQQAQAGQLGTAIQSGAFGGDRTGLAAANLQQQEDLANSNVLAGIANTGYQSALSTAQGEQQIGLAGAQQLASIGSTAYGEGANTASELGALGTGAQTAGLQGASAEIGAGTLQQQTQQAQDTALYNQFLQQQSYPFQVDQFLANIAEGTGALSGSTTTTNQPGGFFSDERLKHDIRPIGKLFDGQTVVSYKMKGDPRTRIGLIAQDVEKKRPHAVGLAGGYKVVDYGKATAPAANRGHFYSGGVAAFRPRALAVGGLPGDLSDILETQREMYGQSPGGMGNFGLQAGSTPRGGGSGRVPPPTGATPQLVTAQAALKQQPTGLQNATSLANLVDKGATVYKDINKARAKASGVTTTTTTPGGLGAGVDPNDYGPPAPSTTDPNSVGPPAPSTVDPSASAGVAGFASGGMPYSNVVGAGSTDLGIPTASGRSEFAEGGMPYSNDPDPTALGIPDDNPHAQLQKAAPLPQQQSTLQQLEGLAGLASAGSSLYHDFFNRGGRAGFGLGGDPDADPTQDPDVTPADFDGVAAAQAPAQSPTPASVPTQGVAAAAPQASADKPSADKPWYKKAENVVPLLEGLAALGTAPTRHLGVALAAGLGAGAQAYLPAQEQEQSIQAQKIANQMAQTRLGLIEGASTQPAPNVTAAPKPPALSGIGVDPEQIVSNARNRFAVSDIWTPQEQQQLSYNQQLQRAGLPNALQSVQALHDARIKNLQTANQQGASVAYDQAYAVASMPQGAAFSKLRVVAPQEADQIAQIAQTPEDRDALARVWAGQAGNALFRYSGRKPLVGKDGIARDELTGRPLLGQVPQGMSAQEHAEYLARLATPVDTGANARPALGNTAAGATLPQNPQPTVQVPGTSAPSAPATAPSTAPSQIAPQRRAQPSIASDLDFSDAPDRPAWVKNPSIVLTDAQKPLADAYGKKEAALTAEANELPQTEAAMIKAQRALNLLPNAKTGPGTDTMSAVQTALGNMTGSQFITWLDNNPSAHALLQKSLGTNALDTTLRNLHDEGAQVRLGQQESRLIIDKLSASTEMPKDAIASLLNWQIEQAKYDQARQAAIPAYLAQGKNAMLFDNYYASPAHHPLSSVLTTSAPPRTTLPTSAGVPTPVEGQISLSKTRRPIVFKGGQWVYQRRVTPTDE